MECGYGLLTLLLWVYVFVKAGGGRCVGKGTLWVEDRRPQWGQRRNSGVSRTDSALVTLGLHFYKMDSFN